MLILCKTFQGEYMKQWLRKEFDSLRSGFSKEIFFEIVMFGGLFTMFRGIYELTGKWSAVFAIGFGFFVFMITLMALVFSHFKDLMTEHIYKVLSNLTFKVTVDPPPERDDDTDEEDDDDEDEDNEGGGDDDSNDPPDQPLPPARSTDRRQIRFIRAFRPKSG
jgi:hypothetical protein